MKRVGYASKNLGSKGVGSKRAYISGIKIFFPNEKVSCIFICWGSRVYREGDIKIPKKKEIPQKKTPTGYWRKYSQGHRFSLSLKRTGIPRPQRQDKRS